MSRMTTCFDEIYDYDDCRFMSPKLIKHHDSEKTEEIERRKQHIFVTVSKKWKIIWDLPL